MSIISYKILFLLSICYFLSISHDLSLYMFYNNFIGGINMNIKNKVRNQLLILTLLSFVIFLFFFFQIDFYIYTYFLRICYTILYIAVTILYWRIYFCKNKNIIPIKEWLENFLEKHPDIHHDQALTITQTYVQKRIFILLIYYFCITTLALFFEYNFIMNIFTKQSIVFPFILCIILFLVLYLFFSYILINLETKEYQSYLNQDYLYIQMTYYLCQVPVFQKALFNYNHFMNISAVLGRLGYHQEAYDFLMIWKQNAKRILALSKLYYYEHCIAHLAMMKKVDETNKTYQEFESFYQKKQRLHQNKQVKTLIYFINIYMAYIHDQKDTIIALEKESSIAPQNNPPQIESILKWAHEEASS